jgi:hypothetical protein
LGKRPAALASTAVKSRQFAALPRVEPTAFYARKPLLNVTKRDDARGHHNQELYQLSYAHHGSDGLYQRGFRRGGRIADAPGFGTRLMPRLG